jgi:hypothetical protein
VNALRTIAVSLVDVYRELVAAARERRDDVRPRVSRGGIYPLARPGTTVISRDVVVFALLEDMLAGRPVAYADFLGYDEAAHHGGLERADSLAVLHSIDQQIGRLHRAAQLAPREYHLVCLSDHGQTQGEAFATRFGETVEQLVGRLCGATGELPARNLTGPTGQPAAHRGLAGRGGAGRGRRADRPPAARAGGARRGGAARARAARRPGGPGAAGGPGRGRRRLRPQRHGVVRRHPGRVSLEEIERHWPALLPGLVDHDGVGFLLVHSEEHGPVVLGRDGLHRLASGTVLGEDPLLPYGPHAAGLVARASTFPHCPDVVVNSRYDPATDEASAFEPHVGSHGGLGGRSSTPSCCTRARSAARRGRRRRAAAPGPPRLAHRPGPPEPTGDGAAVGAPQRDRTALLRRPGVTGRRTRGDDA